MEGSSSKPSGIRNDTLLPCPPSPNCVSSQEAGASHSIEPLYYKGSMAAAKARLLMVIQSMPRSQIISNTTHYVHVTYTSRVFRFIDDVEFLFDQEKHLIQVRSASRKGYSDLGVNRKRIEAIRKSFR